MRTSSSAAPRGGTSEEAVARFGLRDLRHPSETCSPSRQEVTEALDDLAVALDVPTYALGFSGTLGIEWGVPDIYSQGPEFDQGSRTIRLTRRNIGDLGALAHEWFHAFDHIALEAVLGQHREDKSTLTAHCFPVRDNNLPESAGMRALVEAACELVTTADEHTHLQPRTRRLVDQVGAPAAADWLRVYEQIARAFEQYVENRLRSKRGHGNDTLACFPRPQDLDSPDQLDSLYHYPTPAEACALEPRFEDLLSAGCASGVLCKTR